MLSAILTLRAIGADSAAVRFGQVPTAMDRSTPALAVIADSVTIPVFGLKPATTYALAVVGMNRCESVVGATLHFTTEPLPSDLPAYEAGGSNPDTGFVAFAAGNYGLVIDNTGRVVWYHRFSNGAGLNFQPQPDGQYAARPPASGAGGATWVEIDTYGNVTRTLGCARGLQSRLHEMLAQSDGSYWLLCDDVRSLQLSWSPGSPRFVMGTAIQHLSRAGEVLFDWSPFDHFAVDSGSTELVDTISNTINWTHGNAFDLDADGNLLMSFRNLSEITKIDTRTGEVVWRMGGLHNQFTFGGVNGSGFARQHGLRSSGAGEFTVVDNLGDASASRAERYEYNEGLKTVTLRHGFTSSKPVVGNIGGSTQRLPSGHELVSLGNGGSVEEYDSSGNRVWSITSNPGYVFRATRIRSLYAPGRGYSR